MSENKLSEKDFSKLRDDAENAYGTFGEIRCPYLDMNVSFNAKGLDHIKFKHWNKARNREDQIMRLNWSASRLLFLKSHIPYRA